MISRRITLSRVVVLPLKSMRRHEELLALVDTDSQIHPAFSLVGIEVGLGTASM